VHAGLTDALEQRVLRIQRIAVHPRLQRQGIGRSLLGRLTAAAVEEGIDLLGCAFGAEPPLLAFWRTAGFAPVRLGIRVDPASAAHSLFMLRGISARGERLAREGERRFLRDLPWALAAGLRGLDSHLAVLLLEGRDCRDLALDDAERQALAAIAAGARQPATAEAAVWKALVQIAAGAHAPAERLAPLVAGRLQHCAGAQLCRTFALCGRGEADERLRSLLRGQANTLAVRG
jgi:tRNA(Met) cytidine acetyltransferase